MKLPGIVSSLVALIFSVTLWWQGTDGFRAFTSETARRIQVLEQDFHLPNIDFQNQNNEIVSLDDFHGKVVLADFIYTSCADACHNLGYAFSNLQEKLKQKGWLDQVKIISISFDTKHDYQQQLQAYLRRYTSDTSNWNALRVHDPTLLNDLLDSFGVVVLEDGFGGYEHNAAIHLIDKTGKLSGIYDYQSINQVMAAVEKAIEI